MPSPASELSGTGNTAPVAAATNPVTLPKKQSANTIDSSRRAIKKITKLASRPRKKNSIINPYPGRATKTKKRTRKTTQSPDAASDGDDSNSIDLDSIPLSQLSKYKEKYEPKIISRVLLSPNATITASGIISPAYYVGPTENAWEHLAVFDSVNSVQSDESDGDYASAKSIGELRPGDLICYFYYPKTFGDIAGLVWDRITAIRTYHSEVYGPGAELCTAGSHPVTYEHHRVAVYRHNVVGKVLDVTDGAFVSMEYLSLVDGTMSHGTYYSQGHHMSDILRREQTKLNHKFVAEGSITSVDKGVQLVAEAEVKQDTILFRVMLNITNQHKTTISARCIIDAEEHSPSHAIAAAAKHALEIVDDLIGSDLDPSMGADKVRISKALKVGDDVFGSPIKGFGSLVIPSGLLCLNVDKSVPSPLKESLSGTNSPKHHPLHHSNWCDDNGVHWIEFKPVEEMITVFVPREEISTILSFGVSSNRKLTVRPSFVKGSSRADFINRIFSTAKPDHLFPKHRNDCIHHLSKDGGKKIGLRGGRQRQHMFLVQVVGTCYGSEDGCKATYSAGITEDDLTSLACGDVDSVPFSMVVSGAPCKHVWKRQYGRVCGSSRKEQVSAIAHGTDRLLRPSRRAKRNIMNVDPTSFAIGNHGRVATDRNIQYNLGREARIKVRKDLNLTGDMLANVINVTTRLQEIDEANRKKRGDISKDYLGLVQDSGFHDGFKALLFTKECLKVRAHPYMWHGVCAQYNTL